MPMERDRYPDDWEKLSLQIRRDAEWHCEACGKPCRMPGESVEEFGDRLPSQWHSKFFAEVFDPESGEWGIVPYYPQRFCLSVAHLDQDPANNDPNNLAALCMPCHLNHDRAYLTQNIYAKRERNGQLPILLFQFSTT